MAKKQLALFALIRSKPIPKLTVTFVGFGLLALVLYSSWWLQAGRLTSPWLLTGFVLIMLYSCVQILGSWVLYLAAHYADRRRL